jgi:ornithine cyclodeaminase/alanine dehydrogenase
MLILSRADVESVLTMADTLAAVEEGFRRLAAGQVVMPQRAVTPVAPHHGLHLAMPAFAVGDQGDPGALTVKIVTVYGDNTNRDGLPTIQGVLLYHDAATGQPLALMDAEAITALRTGAASGVATRYLARPDAASVTLFGAGGQAAAQLEAMCAVRPIRRATVLTRTGRKDAAFCAAMSAKLGIEVVPARDPAAAVATAEIICTATDSPTPLFDGAWLRPGTHINAVGAFRRTMRELDTATVRRSRVIVDHHSAAQAEAGDILLAIAEGAITYAHVAGELGQVVRGELPGRTRDDELTLFKSVGLAVQDAMTAAVVYARATAQGIGYQVDLHG